MNTCGCTGCGRSTSTIARAGLPGCVAAVPSATCRVSARESSLQDEPELASQRMSIVTGAGCGLSANHEATSRLSQPPRSSRAAGKSQW